MGDGDNLEVAATYAHDLDVLVESRQQVHQAFDGEARQLVVTKRRDLRLRDSQHLGCVGLGELPLFQHLIQRMGEAQLGLALDGIRLESARAASPPPPEPD